METVGRMIEMGVRVRWRCEVCQACGPVDLLAIVKAKGPDVTLGNRRPPCKLCPGRVKFEDATDIYPRPMDTIRQSSPEWWEFSEGERLRLNALGWRVVGGKWTAPDAENARRPVRDDGRKTT